LIPASTHGFNNIIGADMKVVEAIRKMPMMMSALMYQNPSSDAEALVCNKLHVR
jgi:hypothetical protein